MKQNIHILTILSLLLKETDPQQQSSIKHHWVRRLVAFAFFAIFVGGVIFTAWSVIYWVDYFLEKKQTYGSITVEPFQYSREHLLSHHWDSIHVSSPDFLISIKNPHLRLFDILSSKRSLSIKAEQVKCHISPKPKDSTSTPFSLDSIQIPDIYIPIPVFISLDSTFIEIDSSLSWKTQSIKLNNESSNNVSLSIQSVEGSFIAFPLSVDGTLLLDGTEIISELKINTTEDHTNLKVNAPKNDLRSYKIEIEASIQDPKKWLPEKTLPEGIPTFSNLTIQASLTENQDHSDYTYNGTLKINTSEFWPLEPLSNEISFIGNSKEIKTTAVLRNEDGGEISLNGTVDFNLDFNLNGSVKNMSAEFGPQIMPLDIQIHSAIKKGNSIVADLETKRGSKIKGELTNLDSNPRIDYDAKITPTESWALDWTGGHLTLEELTLISGHFQNGKLFAHAKIAPVPYAYLMKADSVETDLVLNKNGILFSNIRVFTQKETFFGSGEVIWADSCPHTAWEINQPNGSFAKAWIDFNDSLKINAEVKDIEVSTIPFAKPNPLNRVKGTVTGSWDHNFENNVGKANIHASTKLEPFLIEGDFAVQQKQDTVIIQKAKISHNINIIEAEATFVIPQESAPKGILPVDILHAWVSSHEFDIPLLLQPLQDSTFKSAFFSGDLAFNKETGLQGNIDIDSILFNHISEEVLKIHRVNLFAEKNKAELNTYLKIGNGGWDGNTQVILSDLFKSKRHLNISHSTKTGGTIWADGFIDSSLTFNGSIRAKDSWFLPAKAGEITQTDLNIDIKAPLKKGLSGIEAQFYSDNSMYKIPSFDMTIPVSFHGKMKDKIITVANVKTKNNLDEEINASVQFNLDHMELDAIRFYSEKYSLIYDSIHSIEVKNLFGQMEDFSDEFIISSDLFEIAYNLNSPTLGKASANLRGKLNVNIPHSKKNSIENTTVNGSIYIDKAVYEKEMDIDISPKSIDRLLTLFKNTLIKFRKSSVEKTSVATGRPTNLSIHISDSQKDSVAILTSIAKFPFSADFWLLGTTQHPILRGDITSSGEGFLGIEKLYEFDLDYFRISWPDVPWQKGILDVSSSQELPYCNSKEKEDEETCPINLNVMGNITAPQILPSSSCGNESSAASMYYNIFLGCISDENTTNLTDWNKLAGKAIGKALSSTANKTLGGDFIGDIDMKIQLFNSAGASEKDSSYFRIPISLDRWVKDLSLIFGYTQDQSENPSYDQSLELGVNYTIPVFNKDDQNQPEHLDPRLTLKGSLISKQYISNTGTGNSESRVEKNIGFNYSYRFWSPCFLGFGQCKERRNAFDEDNEE